MTMSLDKLNKMVEELPEGGYLDLRSLTSIPEGFNPTVGGSLDLSRLTSIPEGFNPTVGGYLYLSSLTSIPEGFNPTVGGSLDLRSLTSIPEKKRALKKVHQLKNGDFKPGDYLYADGILTHVKSVKHVKDYTLYIGKIPGKNVVGDGEHFAHCSSLREGIADLAFKKAKDRGENHFKGMDPDKELTVPELVTMYRIITGACRQGSESFVKSLGQLKEKYSIREAVQITKGQYNAERFAEFFDM